MIVGVVIVLLLFLLGLKEIYFELQGGNWMLVSFSLMFGIAVYTLIKVSSKQ